MNEVLPPTGPSPDANREGQQNYFGQRQRAKALPSPEELVGRIEEAKTSAKLLLQVVQSTPPTEILNHDLIKEFANRCLSASRSIQGYINAEDPAPDNDTLLTLIDTNDQLTMAMSKHQRAVLQARKTLAAQEPSQRGPSPLPNAAAAAVAAPAPANSGIHSTTPGNPGFQQQQPYQQQQPPQLLVDPFRDDNQAPPPPAPLNTELVSPISPDRTSQDYYGRGDENVGQTTGTTQSYQPLPQPHVLEPFNPGYTLAQGSSSGGDMHPRDSDGVIGTGNPEYQYTDPVDYGRPVNPAVNGTEPVMRGGLR